MALLGVNVVQQLDVQLILPTLSAVTGEHQLVVHHADVGILAVHHLHRQEDKSLPLVPAAVRSELPDRIIIYSSVIINLRLALGTTTL